MNIKPKVVKVTAGVTIELNDAEVGNLIYALSKYPAGWGWLDDFLTCLKNARAYQPDVEAQS